MNSMIQIPVRDEQAFAKLLAALKQTAGIPLEQAKSFPPAAYTSMQLLQLERDQLFKKEWLCAGRIEEIPNPGDYITYQILEQSIIIIRQLDGQISSYANVCLHRCAELLTGKGNVSRISCPYHAWSYKIDGQLIGAPYMDKTVDFNTRDQRLPEIRCEIWGGFIYISMNPEIDAINKRLGALSEIIAGFGIENYQIKYTDEEIWETNWKCVMENFMESYHLFRVHSETFEPDTKTIDCQYFTGGKGFSYYLTPAAEGSDYQKIAKRQKHIPENIRDKTLLIGVYPCHLIQIDFEAVWHYSMQPLSNGKSRLRFGIAFSPERLQQLDNVDQYMMDYKNSIELAKAEDKAITEVVFRGLCGFLARPGRLSHFELCLHEFHQYIADHIS